EDQAHGLRGLGGEEDAVLGAAEDDHGGAKAGAARVGDGDAVAQVGGVLALAGEGEVGDTDAGGEVARGDGRGELPDGLLGGGAVEVEDDAAGGHGRVDGGGGLGDVAGGLADDLIEDVFEGDEADGTAVLFDDAG